VHAVFENQVSAPGTVCPAIRRAVLWWESAARRIASFPAQAIAEAKAAVLDAETGVREGLVAEARAFERCAAMPEARQRMETFLARGGQTRELESRVGVFGDLPFPHFSVSGDP